MKRWVSLHEDLDFFAAGVKNSRGRSRTFEENKMIVLALKATLRMALEYWDKTKISWTALESRVSEDFCYRRKTVTEIRKQFFESEGAEVVVFEQEVGAASGKGSTADGNHNKQKLFTEHLSHIVNYVDECHRRGSCVTLRKIQNRICSVFEFEISKTQAVYALKKMGLTYQPVKTRRRNHNAYRPERIQEFIIGKDTVVKAKSRGNKWIFVYMDKLYVHKNHSTNSLYFPAGGGEINRGSGKGRRLIILHAITADGPLVKINPETGKPALGKIRLSGDTPHPILGERLTCEVIWSAESHTGDYHANMNSEKFMLWLEGRLLPTFERVYDVEHKMVLVLNNAPYHHACEIGSLQNLLKKKLVRMMHKDGVDRIELPMTEAQFNLIQEKGEKGEEGEEELDLRDDGEILELDFSAE